MSGRITIDEFEKIFSLLTSGNILPSNYCDHPLKGKFSQYRECHVKGDCLLMYEIIENRKTIRLINTGNHANLFE